MKPNVLIVDPLLSIVDSPAYFLDTTSAAYRKRNMDDMDFVKREFDYDFMKRNSHTPERRALSLFDYWSIWASEMIIH